MANFFKDRKTFKEISKVKIVDEYISKVNYNALEVNDSDLKKLIECEKNILFHQQKSIEHLLALSETLFEAQQVLANYKNGSFRNWFENVGLKKDFVYMCLKRYNLYLSYNSDKVMAIPEKIIKELSNKKIELKKEQILEILEAEKPTKKYEEVKSNLISNTLIYIDDDDENNIFSLEKRIAQKYKSLELIKNEIKDLEYRLSILKKSK